MRELCAVLYSLHLCIGKHGGNIMVMTSYMYHLLFEPVRENECMFLMNDLRKESKNDRTGNKDAVNGTVGKDERVRKGA